MESLKIILLCILAAVVFGILQDQVTARVCVEYFTIGHPPIFDTDSPTTLAFVWGIVATWWVGLILGIPGALVSRVGPWPKFTARRLVRPICCLMVVMACASLIAGVIGYFVAKSGGDWLLEPLVLQIPASKHHAYLADLWAHDAAYGTGFLGGIVVCGWVLFRRWRIAKVVQASASAPIQDDIQF
jgi:H+/Cl- antiporter ClcA